MRTKTYSLLAIIAIFLIYISIQIKCFKINKVILNNDKISNDLNIVQITDFHNNKLINKNRLIEEIKNIDPDVIFLTGDIIDAKTKDFSYSLNIVKDLMDITEKIYFVWGNHEFRNTRGGEFVEELKNIGVIVLDDENIKCQIANNKINIIGLNFFIDEKDYNKAIEGIDEKDYNIILSHSPNRPLRYLNGKEDLILSGHTHGGQVRLPIIGAVIAPGQGYFPKYDKGLFELENSILYIDSGLGNSVFPIRFLNRVQISNVLVKSNMK